MRIENICIIETTCGNCGTIGECARLKGVSRPQAGVAIVAELDICQDCLLHTIARFSPAQVREASNT